MLRTDLDKIKKSTYPVLKKAGVKRSSLFGSYARGEQKKNSDIDIIVDFPRGKGLFEFAELQMELEKALKRNVDLLTYKSINHHIKHQVLSEQIVIYEKRQ